MGTIIFVCSIIAIIAISRHGSQRGGGFFSFGYRTDSADFNPSEGGNPYYFIFDTETSGLPKYRTDEYQQLDVFPRIIQIAYIVFDESEGMVKSDSSYVNVSVPIDPGAFKVHGIHQKKLQQFGKPPEEMYAHIAEEIEKAKVIVAHNQGFDVPILKSELFRIGYDVEKIFRNKPVICTMESTTKFVGLKRKNGSGLKYPKLTELYGKLFYDNTNIRIKQAHDAGGDVLILAKCFLELSRRKILDLEGTRKFVTNREIVDEFRAKQQSLLSLHKSPKSILIYSNLDQSEISYLAESNKDQIHQSIFEKIGIAPEFKEIFQILGIQFEDSKLKLSLLVDLDKVASKISPELNYRTSEIIWKDINVSKYIDQQVKSIMSGILKISNDFFDQHSEINEIEKDVFVWALNKAKGVDENQKIIQVSIPRKSFFELNMERLDPVEAIKLFNPAMKFLKTKGFQALNDHSR
jgi:DNA polymerase-3 subunit epsilon